MASYVKVRASHAPDRGSRPNSTCRVRTPSCWNDSCSRHPFRVQRSTHHSRPLTRDTQRRFHGGHVSHADYHPSTPSTTRLSGNVGTLSQSTYCGVAMTTFDAAGTRIMACFGDAWWGSPPAARAGGARCTGSQKKRRRGARSRRSHGDGLIIAILPGRALEKAADHQKETDLTRDPSDNENKPMGL